MTFGHLFRASDLVLRIFKEYMSTKGNTQEIIRLSAQIYHQLTQHAIQSYPSECCGLVLGPVNEKNRFSEIVPCENKQDEWHAVDPVQYPRTSQQAFLIDPKVLLDIHQKSRKEGKEIKLIYHSHVDVGAYFSEEDRRQAMMGHEPIYPNVVYLVLAAKDHRVDEAKLYAWSPAESEWVEAAWEVI